MRRFPYVLLDVFTSRPLEGNQLAVFTDARGLSNSEMQRLAKETNLSETTFILPRDEAMERDRGVQVRIFTVEEELPFAGHPTLGTAFCLRGNSGKQTIELDLKVGKIPVSFEDRPDGPAFAEMRQRDLEFGQIHDRVIVAAIAGLVPEDFRDDLPIQTVSTGMPFAIAPVSSLACMQSMKLNRSAAEEYLRTSDAKFFYFICTETVDKQARLHARMIFYNGEDPATGSAAGCCAAWMAKYGVAQPDERVMIEQGLEINRPSQIFVRAGRAGAKVADVRVGGHAVEVARGEFLLP